MSKTPKKEKNLGGRPPKYSSVVDLMAQINAFFDLCDRKSQLPEKAGLCIYLGISRETYNQYRERFPDAIKYADQFIESSWVRRLAGQAATGAIFYLKNAFSSEYRDKHETDITSKGESIAPVNSEAELAAAKAYEEVVKKQKLA